MRPSRRLTGFFCGFFPKKRGTGLSENNGLPPYEERRRLAWELLKETRNPEYVALRYEFPVANMRAALEKIPDEEPLWKRLQGEKNRWKGTRPGASEPGNLGDLEAPGREPGSDDDL